MVVGAVVVYMMYSYKKIKNTPEVDAHPSIKILTDQNFQNQIKSGIVLVDFWADWCMPCKMMAPILNEIADEVNGYATVGKLDVDSNRASASKYAIKGIPTMILFKNGKEINRFVGAKTKSALINEINKVK